LKTSPFCSTLLVVWQRASTNEGKKHLRLTGGSVAKASKKALKFQEKTSQKQAVKVGFF
jgi:hypothetical protein